MTKRKFIFALFNLLAIVFASMAVFILTDEIDQARSNDQVIYTIISLIVYSVFLVTYLAKSVYRFVFRMALSLISILLLVFDLWQTWILSGLGASEFITQGYALANLVYATLIFVFSVIAIRSYHHFKQFRSPMSNAPKA